MKVSFILVVAVTACLAFTMADQVPTLASTNATVQGGSHSVGLNSDCWKIPQDAGDGMWWYYNSKDNGPYRCTLVNDTGYWSMFRAYRSGGTQGVHWKYTDDPNDAECLHDWIYYTSDGETVIEKNIKRTTFNGDTRRWCGLPVYRTGGVVKKQWGYCVDNCGFNT